MFLSKPIPLSSIPTKKAVKKSSTEIPIQGARKVIVVIKTRKIPLVVADSNPGRL